MPAKKRAKKEEPPFIPVPEPLKVETQSPAQTPVKPITTTIVLKEKKPRFTLPSFTLTSVSTLLKLRLAVLLIFLLSTVSILMAFVNFPLAAILILIGYVLLLGLLVKLFMVKKL